MCGEYGGNTNRPHYHAIIFGLDFADKKRHSKGKRGDTLYSSEKLNDLWGLGYCWIGNVTFESAGYVARYCLKKINGEFKDAHYQYIDPTTGEIHAIKQEFMACSNGIGLRHFTEFNEQMYLRDSVTVKGKEAPIPRYYDKKFGETNPDLLLQIKEARKRRAKTRAVDNTPERLAVRKEVKEAQAQFLKRELHNDP